MNRVQIISDKNQRSLKIKSVIQKKINQNEIKRSNIVIVIGGDGFMLQTLKKNKKSKKFFYGVNSGSYGFLMNKFSSKNIINNLHKAKTITISPLEMIVRNSKNQTKKHIAINEVSILRQSRQAASLSIYHGSKQVIKKLVSDGVLVSTPAGSTAYNLSVHGPILSLNSKKLSISPISPFRPRRWRGKIVSDRSKIIIKKLVSDGVLVSTPAGSTAYNLSVHGPILSLNSKKLSISPISPFRPRRWKGRIIKDNSKIIIKNLNSKKRPISAVADNIEVRNAKNITIKTNKNIKFNLLYDQNNSLQKKIKIEQLRRET